MKIETKFSNGDTVYGIQKEYHTDHWQVVGPMTVGLVRVEVTDSPGVEGEDTFFNYMPQKKTVEEYMCVETGIGTGALYGADSLFDFKDAAKLEADIRSGLRRNMNCDTGTFDVTDAFPEITDFSESTKADGCVKLSIAELCRLYAVAYHAGHHDTCESQYTDVLDADADSYHEDAVRTFLDEL